MKKLFNLGLKYLFLYHYNLFINLIFAIFQPIDLNTPIKKICIKELVFLINNIFQIIIISYNKFNMK